MLNIRIMPLIISIKSLSRSFHASSTHYNEDDILDLKARIDALKETSAIKTDSNNISDNILLTEEQVSKLSNLDDIIKLSKQNFDSKTQGNTGSSFSSTELDSNLVSEMSTFEEAFPNYGQTVEQNSTAVPTANAVTDENLGLLVRIIKNIVNTNNDILLQVLKEKGIIAGTLDILKHYPLTTIFSLNSNVTAENITQHKAELESQIEFLKGQLRDIDSKVAKNSNDLSKLTDLSDKIDNTLMFNK